MGDGSKKFWEINYQYEDDDEDVDGKKKKPILGIVPPVAIGTRAHESRTVLPGEKTVLPLPKKGNELDADDIARLATKPIIPGTPPKKP